MVVIGVLYQNYLSSLYCMRLFVYICMRVAAILCITQLYEYNNPEECYISQCTCSACVYAFVRYLIKCVYQNPRNMAMNICICMA